MSYRKEEEIEMYEQYRSVFAIVKKVDANDC